VNSTTPSARLSRAALLVIPVAASLALAACSTAATGQDPGAPSGPTEAPSASSSHGVNPLTGINGAIGPVLAVKVANTTDARPQSGLPTADQVWVTEIEGGHLRFVAVYSSDYPVKIGPVRSARETDLQLVPQFGLPGFTYAGADTPVQDAVNVAAKDGFLVDLGKDATVDGSAIRPSSFSTDPQRKVPYNFYANGPALAGFATKAGVKPPVTGGFAFGAPAAGATPCTKLAATWSKTATGGAHWDAGSNSWVISFDGADLIDRESGKPITTTDVVLLRMKDVASTIDRSVYAVPVMQSYGPDGGDAIVMRGGTCTAGHWSRPTLTSPTTLTTANGKPLTLAPGRSWVFTVGIGPSLNDKTERTATTS